MRVFNKIFGFNPKNLYIAKVGVQRTKMFFDDKAYDLTGNIVGSNYVKAVVPNSGNLVLLEKKKARVSTSAKRYKSISDNCYYGEFGLCDKDYALVAEIISPALPVNYGGRIKYKDAEELEEMCKTKTLSDEK